MLDVCEADYRGRETYQERHYAQGAIWRSCFESARRVDASGIAMTTSEPGAIPQRIRESRIDAVRDVLAQLPADLLAED